MQNQGEGEIVNVWGLGCCVQAWNLASPVAEPYHEFAERWGNSEFSKYVDILEQQADEAMQSASEVSIWMY